MRRRRGLSPLLAGTVVAFALAAFAGTGSASAAETTPTPTPGGVNISVTVRDGVAGATAQTPPAGTQTTPRVTTVTTVGGSTSVIDAENPPELAPGEQSIGGILYVSGLSTSHTPSVNPLAGKLDTHFTVRNVSTSIIDSNARFWVSSPFGNEISAVDSVSIAGLKPGESRVVDASLPGVGQWGFATAHFTLTPPTSVNDVALAPLTRDTFVFIPPWVLLALATVGGIAYVVVRLVRSGMVEPIPTPAESAA